MMQAIRDHATGTAAKILFGLIIVSFGGWGASDYFNSASRNNVVGSVNKQEIPRQMLDQEFNQLMTRYAGQDLTPEQTQAIRMEAFNTIVNRIVLSQTIQQLGLMAGPVEIATTIKENPMFKENNVFNRAKYDQLLKQNNMNATQYESSLSQDLALQHLLRAISDSSPMPEGAFSELVAIKNSQRDIKIANFELKDNLDQITITPEEIKQEFEKNNSNYRQPERVKLSYIEISSAAAKANVEVSEAEIKTYFEANQAKFSTPERRESTQLMIIPNKTATSEQAFEKLNEYRVAIEKGTLTFDEAIDDLNKNTQFEISTGSLGELARGAVGDDKIDDAIFSTAEGALSPVFESALGIHLLKVVKISPADTKALADATPSIIETIKQTKAEKAFLDLQEKFQALLEATPDDLNTVATGLGTKVLETDWLNIKEAAGILKNNDILLAVLSDELMNQGKVSPPIAVGTDSAFAVKILKHEAERSLTLEEASVQIENTLKRSKALQKISELALALQKEIESDPAQFEVLATKANATFTAFTGISSSEINGKSQLTSAALIAGFNTVAPEENKTKVLIADGSSEGISVVAVSNVIPGKVADLNPQQAESIKDQVHSMMTIAEYNAYLNSIKKKADVVMKNLEAQ